MQKPKITISQKEKLIERIEAGDFDAYFKAFQFFDISDYDAHWLRKIYLKIKNKHNGTKRLADIATYPIS